jgi:hypothetical protein
LTRNWPVIGVALSSVSVLGGRKHRTTGLVPPALSLRNEGEHVDRVRIEYRDPNDAGVAPARGPALVFAKTNAA